MRRRIGLLLLGALPALLTSGCNGCGSSGSAGSAGPAPSALGSTFGAPLAVPVPASALVAALDPAHEVPYSGPTGTLRGTIRIEGDPPPETSLKFPKYCKGSAEAYGHIFRVGADHALADALVAVTQYKGFVPAKGEAIRVQVKGCVPEKLTYAATFGQRVDFYNVDEGVSYQPYLDGAGPKGIMVASPHAAPVLMNPMGPSPAHYMLRDQLQSGLVANVFLLNYATFDVTGLDGRYEIRGIPVGKARVDAMLAVISKSDGKYVDIVAGDNTLDLTLHFDAAKDLPERHTPRPEASASATAAPSASASARPK